MESNRRVGGRSFIVFLRRFVELVGVFSFRRSAVGVCRCREIVWHDYR